MMKKVMVRAWKIAKEGQKRFGGKVQEYLSEALKISWKAEKGMTVLEEREEIVALKSWFVDKNFDQHEAYAIRNEAYRFEIVRETEKAYKFIIHTEYGKIFTWAPKSVCLTEAQERKEAEKFLNAWENGLKRNQELHEKAIAMGIKGIRKRMKTETLLRKIAEHKTKIA